MNKLCNYMLREICKFLSVVDCIHIEEILFKTVPKTYKLYNLSEYEERKKYEPIVKRQGYVDFHVSYENACFTTIVYSNKKIIKRYAVKDAVSTSEAFKKAFCMFLRGPGFWYGITLYTIF